MKRLLAWIAAIAWLPAILHAQSPRQPDAAAIDGNIRVCLERSRRRVVLLANDVRAEAMFEELAERILGPTALPWDWEYPQFAD